jgi:hypothetical protein
MSRGGEDRGGKFSRAADVFSRIVVPAAAGLTLSALIVGRGQRIEYDLHLLANDGAARGQSLPLRAQLYGELDRPEGPRLIAREVTVELRSEGRVLARSRLRRGYGDTLEGSLSVPADAKAGAAELFAKAELDDTKVTISRPIEIAATIADTQPAQREERPLPALQRFAAGPIRAEPNAQAPSALFARVEGGACVPEQPCRVWLHVGEPAAAIRVVPTPSVTPDAASREASKLTSGVVGLQVITHGPEAELRISAERGGAKVAARAFRLPIALGAFAMRDVRPVIAATEALPLGLQVPERGCIADGFLAQRWAATATLADCRGGDRLPFAPLAPGLWRVQLRRDAFATPSVASATLYVRRPAESDDEVLSRLARTVLEREPDDALAQHVNTTPAALAGEFTETAGYLLAAQGGDLLALPPAMSGYPRALALQEATHARARKYALFALGLCALSIGFLVAQRGLSAAEQAGRLMAQAGEAELRIQRQRQRMLLRVLATVSSLLLAFAAIAAYVIARGASP